MVLQHHVPSQHFSITLHHSTSASRSIAALQHDAPVWHFSIMPHHSTSTSRSITALQHHAPLQHFSITLQYGTSALPFSSPFMLTLTCAVSLFVAKALDTPRDNGLPLPEIHHKQFNVCM
jgi:hypothetical protein